MSAKRPSFGIFYVDIPLVVITVCVFLLSCSPIEIGEAIRGKNIFIIQTLIMLIFSLFVITMIFRAFWPLFMQWNISLFYRLAFLVIYLSMSYVAFSCFFFHHPRAMYVVETTWNWIRKSNLPLGQVNGDHVVCVDGRAAQVIYSSQVVNYCHAEIILYIPSKDQNCSDGNFKKTVKNLGHSWLEEEFSDGTASVLSCLIP